MPRFGPLSLRSRAVSGSWPLFWLIGTGALLVRLYLASLWFRFGMTKLEVGWLTTNPVRELLELVASGQTPMPIPSLSIVADALLAVRADAALSVVLPLTELVLAAAFLTGFWVRLAAVGGIAVNASLILGGLASLSFDGRIIALQALLLLAGSRAGAPGVTSLPRLVDAVRRAARSLETATGQASRRRAA
jgi:uncharacterized membrane protein YphA (DoxX/SURF4 family)